MAAQEDKIAVQENKIAALEQENSKLWQEIHRVSELRLEYFQRYIYIKPPAERATISS
jgi:Tfp pilus assembly protein PilN